MFFFGGEKVFRAEKRFKKKPVNCLEAMRKMKFLDRTEYLGLTKKNLSN